MFEKILSFVSGKPSMATINSSPEGLYRNSYNLTWSIKSSSPLEKVRILFRKMVRDRIIETGQQNLRLIKGRFPTLSGLFFAKYINIFHKTEIQTVILKLRMRLNLNWFKSYDKKYKYFPFPFFQFCQSQILVTSLYS